MEHKRLLVLLMLLGSALGAMAQKVITGTVLDEAGEALVGVNIVIRGTSTGTIANVTGDYSLEVPGDDAVLVFSYTGYKTLTVTVGTRSVIDVNLEEDITQLGEIVVSALGFEQNRDEMGATSSVISTENVVRSGESTILNGLGSKASNVRISRSNGDPGAGSTIRIRGANSITGASDPLIIVDGVPMNNSTNYSGGNGGRSGGTSQQSRMNDLNPNDIESVQILKGASAASLWGSRAANGVVVITTKAGKEGKMKIDFKSTLSFDDVTERTPMQSVWGQGRDGVYGATRAESWGDYIPDRAGGADEVDASGQYFEANDGTLYYPTVTKNSRETFVDSNWDQIYQRGGYFQNDLSISGGSEKGTYFMSLGRMEQEGIIINSNYDRTNMRFNTTMNLTDWLNVKTKAAYTKTFSNRMQQSSNTAGVMLGLMRNPADFDIRDYKGTYTSSAGEAFAGRQRSYRRYMANSANPTYNNPLWTINEQKATTDVNRLMMNSEINITPTSWLNLTMRGGADYYADKRAYFWPVGSAGSVSGEFSEDMISELEVNFDMLARGNFDLTNDISLQATVGWNYNDRQYNRLSTELVGFLVNSTKQTTDLNTSATNSGIENFRTFRLSNRGYASLSFDLYNQVYVNITGAQEAASTISGAFFYPSADVAWQFSETLDLTNSPLSFAKLRASWGKVGIQPGPHNFQTLAEGGFGYSTYSDFISINAFGGGFRVDDDQGNPELEPEIKTEWEIGTDLRFFDDKLSLTATYYQNKIEGILLRVDVAPTSGYDTQFRNGASMKNAGFELETEYSIYNKGDWNVNVYGNWSTNENEVTDLSGTETVDLAPGASVSSRAIVGQPMGILYGTGSQTDPVTGDYILDANGFPQLTPSPIVLGDPNADWRAGFGINAKYKGWGFNVLFDHSEGGVFSPRTLWVLRRFGTTEETANRMTLSQDLTNFDGDVITSGTSIRGNVENFGGGDVLLDETWYRHGIGGGFGDNQAYNFSLFDATNTRLRELSLSYSLDSQGFRDITKLQSATFTATGRNLFLWDDIPGIDPEINQVGVGNAIGLDYFTNPTTKSFLFSLAVTF